MSEVADVYQLLSMGLTRLLTRGTAPPSSSGGGVLGLLCGTVENKTWAAAGLQLVP